MKTDSGLCKEAIQHPRECMATYVLNRDDCNLSVVNFSDWISRDEYIEQSKFRRLLQKNKLLEKKYRLKAISNQDFHKSCFNGRADLIYLLIVNRLISFVRKTKNPYGAFTIKTKNIEGEELGTRATNIESIKCMSEVLEKSKEAEKRIENFNIIQTEYMMRKKEPRPMIVPKDILNLISHYTLNFI